MYYCLMLWKSYYIERFQDWKQMSLILTGRLYINNVQEIDQQNGKAYVCMAINYFMRRNTYDKANYIIPRGSKLY
jgi:hypothetical protein